MQAQTLFANYQIGEMWDDLYVEAETPRSHYDKLYQHLLKMDAETLIRHQQKADHAFFNQGITFTVYNDNRGTERIFPFDVLPRIISAAEWQTIERGLAQRIVALNHFIKDIYHKQQILADGVIPRGLILSCPNYVPEMVGTNVPKDVYVSIAGMDLVRVPNGAFHVLEDNLRVPSGVSYMLGNRQVMKTTFPKIFEQYQVRPIDHYPQTLLETLRGLAPANRPNPTIVLLTPGVYNSAYYEHTFLARQMGIELVEGRDLAVEKDIVYMRTTAGMKRVDVIYRRIDDDFLDPEAFRADSVLGVAGLMRAYRAGNVGLANAAGTALPMTKRCMRLCPI